MPPQTPAIHRLGRLPAAERELSRTESDAARHAPEAPGFDAIHCDAWGWSREVDES